MTQEKKNGIKRATSAVGASTAAKEAGAPKGARTDFTAASLEKWRLENQLTTSDGAASFGLPIAKWYGLLQPEKIKEPLQDLVLAMLRCLYTQYPQSAPKRNPPSIPKFYGFLGFEDTREDKIEFARLIGRQYPSVYRLLDTNGRASRPLVRYIEALQQLGLNGAETRKVMEQIAAMAYVPTKSK